MADIHIERTHALGLSQARKVAFQWAEQAEQEFGMRCTYEQGADSDVLSFSRSGVDGTLTITPDDFVLNAKLGFLLGVFKDKIESKITENLDALIAEEPAPLEVAAADKPAAGKA